MRAIKSLFGFLISRLFWTIIGLILLCAAIWLYGPLLKFGEAAPLAGELTRIIVIGAILIVWLLTILIRQIRSARANRMFVTELSTAPAAKPGQPGDANVAEVQAKFAGVLDQLGKSKLGKRKFLRDMPWYVIIGPPGTGKTTALKQSGLHFPIDLSDDIKGVGGTRNCDWFFTEDAVLVDTAGRYTEQASDAAVDAAEWQGFLGLLKKHRGRRALNGVIVTLSVQELMLGDSAIRTHGREIRKRLAELREKLEIQLPVYLMITKVDLIPGFTSMFDDLTVRQREQVWGATLATDARVDGTMIERELRALQAGVESRLTQRIAADLPTAARGEVFRFPAQFDALTQPMKLLIDTVFGESRYEEAPWLRGFYFTSATQEGNPIDRMLGAMGATFGMPAPEPVRRAHGERRSFFLRNMLTELIFPEAGLGTFDPKAEERRSWVFRGTLAGAALATVLGSAVFLYSYLRNSGLIADQEAQFTQLNARLANVAVRQAPTDPLDLPLALEAATEVAAARSETSGGPLTAFGPSATPELVEAQRRAYDRVLANVLEPRMVALLEATMWRQIRDPDYLFDALKVYLMFTGKAPFDPEYVAAFWQTGFSAGQAPLNPVENETALEHQLAAIERRATDGDDYIAPDDALLAQALETVCTIPLSERAYRNLLADPNVTALADWIPAEFAGPNGARVLTRLSGQTLRVGLPGAFTRAGFRDVIAPLIPEVAAQAVSDRQFFEGGCSESANIGVGELQADITKLYYDDFIDRWNGFLRDVRLAPITELAQARENLRDLSSEDSALKRLLVAVVAETHLNRPEEAAAGGGGPPPGLIKKALGRLGTVGRLAQRGSRLAASAGGGGGADAPAIDGAPVADAFAPIRGMVEEIDGIPARLGDAVAALTALSNELQTVAATPDPQAALLARGGLPQLTGAISTVATSMPDPVDDWLGALAGGLVGVTRTAVVAQLNARLRADVLPFCTSATGGRYPFDQGAAIDVNIADFARLFGPGGIMAKFTDEQLLPYIDTTQRPWAWRADFGMDPALLTSFENARRIRDALFPGGAGPVMAFVLEAKDLSANAARVTLNVDGQNLTYFNAAAPPMPMTWPGPGNTQLVTLSFAPVDGSAEIVTSEVGAWAFLRLIRKARLQPTDLPEVFRLSLGANGYAAQFELRAASVDNPFNLQMFSGFACPQGF